MIHISHTSQWFEEDSQIVAICPEPNVSSFGDNPEEALFSLREAITLFLEECQRMGTLQTVLEEAEYHRDPTNPELWIPRQPIQINYLDVCVA